MQSQRKTARHIGPLLAQVEAWQPPTPDHEGVKNSMRESLLEFDETVKPIVDYADTDLPMRDYTGENYQQQRIKQLTRDIAYVSESREEAIASAEKSTAWVQAMAASMEAWQPVEVPARQLP